jgi:uncharacterized protein (TIGR03083 family)
MAAANPVVDAAHIQPASRAEGSALNEAEIARWWPLLESLAPDDWSRATACTLWNVQQMVAHQAGAYAGFAHWSEFRRQYGKPPARGRMPEDVLNDMQVADRANRTPAELVAELREAAPRAIANRNRPPLRWMRAAGVPHPAFGFLRFSYMFDVVYPRDTWMHRLDICRATGRPMQVSAAHDGRIVALVVRDLARTLAPKLGGASVVYALSGEAGGAWRIGANPEPSATIRMDALDFNVLASGRMTADEARRRQGVEIGGDVRVGELALGQTSVIY